MENARVQIEEETEVTRQPIVAKLKSRMGGIYFFEVLSLSHQIQGDRIYGFKDGRQVSRRERALPPIPMIW